MATAVYGDGGGAPAPLGDPLGDPNVVLGPNVLLGPNVELDCPEFWPPVP
jgi:hypothetical protein